MNLDEIRAEMQRKPDAQYLIEWLFDHADLDANDLRWAIDAYYAGLENS